MLYECICMYIYICLLVHKYRLKARLNGFRVPLGATVTLVFERRVPKDAVEEDDKSVTGDPAKEPEVPTSPIPDPIEVPIPGVNSNGPMSPGVTLGRSTTLNSPTGGVPEAFTSNLYDIDEGEREFDSDGNHVDMLRN